MDQGSKSRFPQGLKPAWFLALTARLKAVPFHKTIYEIGSDY